MELSRVQAAMQQEGLDCWVVYDFQGTNPIMSQLLRTKAMMTRRVFLVIPAQGEAQLLGSRVDHDSLQPLPFKQNFYSGWQEMEQKLAALLEGCRVVGMDYSPQGLLPTVSRVDAGTVEMLKKMGKEIRTSANILQAGVAIWGQAILEAHLEDSRKVANIKDEAFDFIARQLRSGAPLTEYQVQSFIMERFEAEGLWTAYPPVVAVNQNSSDPHYTPEAGRTAPIQKRDWILIDLWAKRPGYEFVYGDMTWVGLAGPAPSARQQEVFETVAAARDKAVDFIQEQAQRQTPVEGWEVDDVARKVIQEAGYGDYFFHRTGHSLSSGNAVHGSGVNLDNLETHDTRPLAPGVGFTIEPGIYLPEFGVRLEINLYMEESGPRVTTPIQQSIICLEV